MGKASRAKRDARVSRSAADPEGLLSRILQAERAEDGLAENPHLWVVAYVCGVGDEDEALRLARAQADGGDLFELVDAGAVDVLGVQGVYCAACGKQRGTGAMTTRCTDAVPVWLQRQRVRREMEELGRVERRNLTHKKRRALRRRALADAMSQIGPDHRAWASSAVSEVDTRPTVADMEVPVMADPDPARPATASVA